ncbi:phage integrase family protein [Pseudomonas sp. URMO17WK12:I10]|uniref:tyrosine-type recombinase/integrase n=1 Tax=unclassified Pseudomonas TaxID=196821 RepID=UPI0004B555C7|nr:MULTISPECIES: site-specific integrase [unclassified Pseudomonas]RDL24520.1 phage integrase family protein [Pseudomonas sp. LAMO17WK12:I3]RED11738.1 phage integrase family protein [Pseudomonas sp. URMO17WK12:I10]SOD10199.1 Integrase [Pseudomonas sp. URMO17WK12:I9]
MTTKHIIITDAEIRKQAGQPVRQLRDPRYPELRFRYSSVDRTRGAWHVVVRGKWGKAGDFPSLTTKAMLTALPAILARRAIDTEATSLTSTWSHIGELLDWYLDRMLRDRNLSEKRKAGAKSAITCHLMPRLHDLPLAEVSKATLDQRLMWPLQERYALSFVRLVFNVLAVAMRKAHRLGMIEHNPMDSLRFGDFVGVRIKPKSSRLRERDLPDLLAKLANWSEARPADALLALMMLCHGTRLGETRSALWRNVDLQAGQWFIPADDTKTKQNHTLPLTRQACALLSRYQAQQVARGYQGAYLFPASRRGPLGATAASQVFAELSDRQWTSHDVRKVARTCWMDLGVDYLVGEMLVNHALRNMDATYIHTTAEALKRQALERWHDQLDRLGLNALTGETYPRHEVSQKQPQATDHAASGNNPDASQRSM